MRHPPFINYWKEKFYWSEELKQEMEKEKRESKCPSRLPRSHHTNTDSEALIRRSNMKEFEKWLEGKAGIGWYTGAEEGWRAALEHFNSLFNKGVHPQDVIFAMQKELDEELGFEEAPPDRPGGEE